jgi:hypothetical protein
MLFVGATADSQFTNLAVQKRIVIHVGKTAVLSVKIEFIRMMIEHSTMWTLDFGSDGVSRSEEISLCIVATLSGVVCRDGLPRPERRSAFRLRVVR